MAVDFPLPAGPTRTSSGRPEVTTWTTAAACSADSTRPVSSSGAAHTARARRGVDAGAVGASAGVDEPGFGVEDLDAWSRPRCPAGAAGTSRPGAATAPGAPRCRVG